MPAVPGAQTKFFCLSFRVWFGISDRRFGCRASTEGADSSSLQRPGECLGDAFEIFRNAFQQAEGANLPDLPNLPKGRPL